VNCLKHFWEFIANGGDMQNAQPTGFASAASNEPPWALSGSKRFFDVACAILFITASAPLMVMVALVIKASSQGPILFRQNRLGKNGEEFSVLKFRTMYSSTGNSSGALITRSGDCRVTAVGKWLRKWKLDELPQFVNVLKGDMTLVGHRPDMLQYMQTLTGRDRNILYFHPGITSPASLRFRNEGQELAKVPPEEMEQFSINHLLPQKIRMDLDYAERATFLTDCRVVLRTALSVLWCYREASVEISVSNPILRTRG
jgi:lipopolysaccharide/colanic/teichoic acid biosynthesis glycosyltransferase